MAKFGSFIKTIKMQKIKICGIKSVDEARVVLSFDISYIGVIFAKSKRKVGLDLAMEISNLVHKNKRKIVSVFADISEDEILEISKKANLDVVQIYGEISPNLYKNLHLENIEIWKVFSVSNELPNLENDFYDMPLFDCKGKNIGGNGISFDWSILKNLKTKFGLAGGIGAHNISLASSYNPEVIDINSMVEDENGIKSAKKISLTLSNLMEIK